MEKNLTKAHYLEFIHTLTGHSKAFIENNMTIKERPLATVFTFVAGTLSYHTWVNNGRLYTQCFLGNSCQCAWYHDFYTLDYDWKFSESIHN